jgi:tRNA modification GTPase
VAGPQVPAILRALFRPVGPVHPLDSPRRLIYGDILDESGHALDRGLAVWFPPPSSPTGTAYAELHIHGGTGLVRLVLGVCNSAGARPARPGEFLQRAFFNGKISLDEAEGVAAALAATTRSAARSAARSLSGELGQRIRTIRESLILAAALFEAAVDFPDEDLPPQDEEAVSEYLHQAGAGLDALLRQARRSVLIHTGARVVLAGRPNAGKSSLFNALLGLDRAIVSPEPGTTRDTLEATLDLGGIPVTLVDTAGLHDAPGAIEQEGIRRTRNEMSTADLILHLVPANDHDDDLMPDDWPESIPVMTAISKSDLESGNWGASATPGELSFSARTGDGIEELLEAVSAHLSGMATRGEALGAGSDSESAKAQSGGRTEAVQAHGPALSEDEGLLTNQRQVDALRHSRHALVEVTEARQQGLPPELITIHLRESIVPLDQLLGTQASEDILTALFSRFCIGK